MLIYKILRAPEWAVLQDTGESPGAPVDVADGFVHLSTADQLAATLAKHFASEDGLFVVAFKADDLGAALKWEVSRGGAQFPHLYRHMSMEDVLWTLPLPLGSDGGHEIPGDVR